MVKKPAPVPVLREDGEPVLDEEGNPTYEPAPEPEPAPRKPVFAQHTASSGLCVAVTTQRRVVQRVAARGPDAAGRGRGSVLNASSFRRRRVASCFPTARRRGTSSDGAVEILHPDGNVSRRAADGTAWEGTNDAGARWSQGDPYEYVPKHVPEVDENGEPILMVIGTPRSNPNWTRTASRFSTTTAFRNGW